MANQRRKQQLSRLLPIILLGALIVSNSGAGDIDPSGYQLFAGSRFFLLTDSSFSSKETAKVRFEADESQYALEKNGGIDIRLYKVPNPLEFLRKQRNLHRPNVQGSYRGEGLSNVLSYLWDSFYKKSRLAWQKILSSESRKVAVSQNPDFKATPAHTYQTKFENEAQYAPIKGLTFVEGFRYPVSKAKPLVLNDVAKLAGSSSEFTSSRPGNVYIPLGKREPGLYLVEGLLGSYRAVCLLFVSDQVEVSKVSSSQLVVWAVDKSAGSPAPGTKVMVTDGVGLLGQGVTGPDGVFLLKKKMPEKVYVLAEDKGGGVFISDNFYYDSEILQTKVLVHTDRPLYQPGDQVFLKAFVKGDEKWGSGELTVLDPTGTAIISKSILMNKGEGGDLSFHLPQDSFPGGYGLRLRWNNQHYSAAFRVARYIKPHFEMEILAKPSIAVKEPVAVDLALRYASGKPVVGAKVQILLKAEMYSLNGLNTVALEGDKAPKLEESYTSNGEGKISLKLPACDRACKYKIEARAVDTGAFRVSASKEILVQGFVPAYTLESDFTAVDAGQSGRFRLLANAAESERKAVSWRAIRLEDQTSASGPISSAEFSVPFARAGSYSVQVLGSDGSLLATTSYWAKGPELSAAPGQLLLTADKAEYQPGETAKVLLSFPEKVDHALLSLELNEVRRHGLMSSGGGWVKTRRLNEKQWQAELPVSAALAPNVVFSVAYVKNGNFVFQNKGIVIKKPDVRIQIVPARNAWAPGERVKVKLKTSVQGKPVSSMLSVSVVDEMIYMLQPELAPEMQDFFFHRRRNQVRTNASTNFYTYDSAVSPNFKASAPQATYSERSLKMMGRARRDNRDTAYWNPKLRTNSAGEAEFEFIAPDSLARWRITARAQTEDNVGQSTGYLETRKDYYIQFLGARLQRKGDQARAPIAIFNTTGKDTRGELVSEVAGKTSSMSVGIPHGVQSESLPLALPENSNLLKLSLVIDGKNVDSLELPVEALRPGWPVTHSVFLSKNDLPKKVDLPEGVSELKLIRTSGAKEKFLAVVDGLIDYPYGCVEQTATRMISLTEAVNALKGNPAAQDLEKRLANSRSRLVNMALPEARFSWWGEQTEGSAFLTAYAYYADWRASSLLGMEFPESRFDSLMRAYTANAGSESWAQKVWTVWLIKQMGGPVENIAQGLVEEAKSPIEQEVHGSLVFYPSAAGNAAATLILDTMAQGLPAKMISDAETRAKAESSPPLLSAALLYRDMKNIPESEQQARLETLLNRMASEIPTLDRSLALALISPKNPKAEAGKEAVPAGWKSGRNNWVMVPEAAPRGQIAVPALGGDARLEYTVQELPAKGSAPVQISRKLYVLNPGVEPLQFQAVEFTDWEALDTSKLYLDEITVTSSKRIQYGAVEVPLPPGGQLETTVWGLSVLPFTEEQLNFENLRAKEGILSYTLPFASFEGSQKVYTLVRFGLPGNFNLPPARYFSMYRPSEQALEGGSSEIREIQVR